MSRTLLVEMHALAPTWLEGCRLRPFWFEPTFYKHVGKLCEGFQIHVDDSSYDHAAFRPWRLVALALKALRRLQPGLRDLAEFRLRVRARQARDRRHQRQRADAQVGGRSRRPRPRTSTRSRFPTRSPGPRNGSRSCCTDHAERPAHSACAAVRQSRASAGAAEPGRPAHFLPRAEGWRAERVARAVRQAGRRKAITHDTKRGIREHCWALNGKTRPVPAGRRRRRELARPQRRCRERQAARPHAVTRRCRRRSSASRTSDRASCSSGLNDREPEWHDLYEIDIATGERKLVEKNEHGFAGYLADLDLQPRVAVKTLPRRRRRDLPPHGKGLGTASSSTGRKTASPRSRSSSRASGKTRAAGERRRAATRPRSCAWISRAASRPCSARATRRISPMSWIEPRSR